MAENTEPTGTPALSKREREVLIALTQGMIDKEVAASLGVSLGTVRVYRKRLQTKLNTRGLVQSLLVAWKLGLIDIEPIAQAAMERGASRRNTDKVSKPGRTR